VPGRVRQESGDLREYLDRAVEMGASEARVIEARTIRCEPWVRFKCMFGCGGYNKRLTCPPFTPGPEETARAIACYRRAILIHSDDPATVNEIVPKLERDIFLDGHFKALGFGSGPCRLCERCDIRGRCKYPYLARPSMEACGIDVFTTVRTNGFEIEVVRTEEQKGDYYGLILVD
jgi:predicted metal-binding protein